jgi:nitroimidazol reductase NimA-like FMN-containing flavoprotein (pyridoxamine 5'-phosphate oxidase superfamily)
MFRTLRRINQALDDQTCRRILQEGRRGVLALHGDDDYAYAVPLNYSYDETLKCIYFHGSSEGHKIDAIRRNNRVSFNVLSDPIREEGKWWNAFDSVTVFGTIEMITDQKEKRKALYAIGRKYFPESEDVDHHVQSSLDHVCMLRLDIRYMSGKHVKEK